MDAAYPVMNEHQLAIGETTTGGKRELRSTEGLIDAPELYRLVLERATNAREAIRIADELTKEFGYNDWGECFTFADPEEVWFFEILGPGSGKDRRGLGRGSPSRRSHRRQRQLPPDPGAGPGRPGPLHGLGQRPFPGAGDGLVGSGKRRGVPVRLRLRRPDQPLLPAPGVAGPEPAGPFSGPGCRMPRTSPSR